MKKFGLLVILAIAISFATVSNAQGEVEYAYMNGSDYSFERIEWPAGVSVEVSIGKVQQYGGDLVDVVFITAYGAEEMEIVGNLAPRFDQNWGGFELGPIFMEQLADGSIHPISMYVSNKKEALPFQKKGSIWQTYFIREWLCRNTDGYTLSLVLHDYAIRHDYEIDLDLTQNYFVAGNGVEKHISAHGPTMITVCK
ncbi:MAG: hypothetical protein NT136_04180 [Candidatus Moranbacteria bacterium]|nr:hypothetical protein [Candidatus Moranbacteria bacterium]